MRHRPTVILTFLAWAALLAAADPLSAVFARIDAAARSFRGLTADITHVHHVDIVDDDDTQTGTIRLSRVSAEVTRVLADLQGPRSTVTYALNGKEALIYNPKTKVEEVRDIGKHQDDVKRYMLLGFGSTSAELRAAYEVSWVGEEKIGGAAASHLKLIPKTRGSMKQAELWYGENGLVVQQKFLENSGDYTLVTYSNMKWGPVAEKDLELKLPKGAKIQHDQN